MLELPEPTQDAIRSLDEHWDGSGHPRGLRGEEIPLLGRILCLAQSVEVFVRTMGARGAYGMALKRRGRWFDPALVDAMLGFRDDAAFWGPLEDARAVPPVAGWEPRDRVLLADEDQLDRVAEAFARVIDAKSPYTASHSAGRGDLRAGDRRRDGHGRHAAARPAPRRAAARHRQARDLLADPRQAGPADRRGVRRDARAHALHAADPRAGALLPPPRRRSRPATTSGSTARATTAGWRRSTCRGPRASWPSPTSSTRSPPTAPTARRCRSSRRWRSCARTPAARSARRPWRAWRRRSATSRSSWPRSRLISGTMKVSVRLFAGLRERAGSRYIDVELPDGANVADLLAAMAATPVGEIARRAVRGRDQPRVRRPRRADPRRRTRSR